MRIFLTGGTGFIGSYVLKEALNSGHDVIALRRSYNSFPIIPLTRQPIWHEGHLAKLEPSLLKNIDVIVHLAAVGVSPKRASYSELISTNVVNTFRLMELASEAKVPRFVAAGSSHEYGRSSLKYKFIPPNAPLEPLNMYGASKAAAYQLMRSFSIEVGLEFLYGRIFSVYGKGQYAGNFWPSLYRAALANQDFHMTLGNQVCDFLTVDLVARHFLYACTRCDLYPGVPKTINIASGNGRSLYDFAQEEWSRLGAKGSIVRGSLPTRKNQLDRCVAYLDENNIF